MINLFNNLNNNIIKIIKLKDKIFKRNMLKV